MRSTALLLMPALALLVMPTGANAFVGYRCVVKSGYEFLDGRISESKYAKLSISLEFKVDRTTGWMFGAGVMSSEGRVGRNEVLHPGSESQPFKALYTSAGPFINVRLLQIRENDPGSAKNFMFVDGTDVYTGSCVHID